MVIHKVSLIQPLPEAYKGRIEAIDGVVEVSHADWFGGVYQDPRNFFTQFAIEPESYLRLYPEYILTDTERDAFFRTRTGAIAGRDLADRFGWKIGDRIPIQGTIYRPRGGDTWEFTLEGIYDGAEEGTPANQFFFHHEYLAEATTRAGALSGSMSSRSTTRRAPTRLVRRSMRASPTPPPKRRRRQSRRSPRPSRARSATSAPS